MEKDHYRIQTSILQAVNTTVLAVERYTSFSGIWMDFSHWKSSLKFNSYFSIDGDWGSLKRSDTSAVNLVLPVVYGFIDRANEYTETTNITQAPTMYHWMISRVISSSWSREWLSIELNESGAEGQELYKRIVELLSSASPQEVYKMKLHLLALF